jgi:hypothetical protein
LNRVQARVDALKADLAALENPAGVQLADEVEAPVAPPRAPRINDGFEDVVPADLKDLVEEDAPALPRRAPFVRANAVLPSGIDELLADSDNVEPLVNEPFSSILPNDA